MTSTWYFFLDMTAETAVVVDCATTKLTPSKDKKEGIERPKHEKRCRAQEKELGRVQARDLTIGWGAVVASRERAFNSQPSWR